MYLTIVRVGSDSRPASEEDINQVRDSIEYLVEKCEQNSPAILVSHHNVDVQQVYIDQCCGQPMQQSLCAPPSAKVVVRGVCDAPSCEDTGPCESEPY